MKLKPRVFMAPLGLLDISYQCSTGVVQLEAGLNKLFRCLKLCWKAELSELHSKDWI